MGERIRRWCTIHHFFHRDCNACVDKDYTTLERQLAEVQALGPDFDTLLRAAHKEHYRRTIIDYPPVDPNGHCHSLCRHVSLLNSALARILKEEK